MAEFHPITGREILRVPGGEMTEYSATVVDQRLNNGRPTVIPTVVGGRVVSIEDAIMAALIEPQRWPSFSTVDEANAYAERKSKAIGNTMEGGGSLEDRLFLGKTK